MTSLPVIAFVGLKNHLPFNNEQSSLAFKVCLLSSSFPAVSIVSSPLRERRDCPGSVRDRKDGYFRHCYSSAVRCDQIVLPSTCSSSNQGTGTAGLPPPPLPPLLLPFLVRLPFLLHFLLLPLLLLEPILCLRQIQKVVIALGDYLDAQCHACIGGTNVRADIAKLEMGQHIVVGTPGRVFDMISRRALGGYDLPPLPSLSLIISMFSPPQ